MTTTKAEIWKDIPGYETKYQVSNIGRVLSCPRHLTSPLGKKYIIPERILKPAKCKEGYFTVAFSKSGKLKTWRVHRLVALAFIPNNQNHPVINHKNGIKTDNTVENLEWCTHEQNTQHAYRTGLATSKALTERNTGRHRHLSYRAKEVHQFSIDGQYIRSFKCLLDAKEQYSHAIGSCVINKQSTSCGFKWSYSKQI